MLTEEAKADARQQCIPHGLHVVENIKPLDPEDVDDAYHIERGFNWRGTCKNCKSSIIAKNKSEYDLEQYA